MTLRNIAASMRHLRAGGTAVAAGNVLACAGLVGFIACADGGVTEPAAPKAADAKRPSGPSADVAPNWWYQPAPTVRGDTTINTFTMDAHAGGSPYFGPNKIHQIVIPADAICDSRYGYGATYWNQWCAPAVGNVTFTVKSWKGSDGSPRVSFYPDVRFAPSQTVLLKLSTSTTTTTSSRSPTIYWCTSWMTGCVNEGTTDPSLVTSFDPFAKTAWRRVKHLSGYNLGW